MHGKYLYLASEDGSAKILKIKKTKIEMVRSLVKVGDSKALSIELQVKEDEKTLVQ